MAIKWCPNCRREILEPPLNPTTSYAKFYRNLCHICDCPLRTIGEPSQNKETTSTTREASPSAEPQSRPTSAHDSARKAEADRLRCKYETRKSEVDRLRFEYEKHQRSIQALQTKVARLSREEQDMLDLNEKIMSSDDPHTADALHRAFSLRDEITACEREISTAERWMEMIRRDLDQAEREMKDTQQALYEKER